MTGRKAHRINSHSLQALGASAPLSSVECKARAMTASGVCVTQCVRRNARASIARVACQLGLGCERMGADGKSGHTRQPRLNNGKPHWARPLIAVARARIFRIVHARAGTSAVCWHQCGTAFVCPAEKAHGLPLVQRVLTASLRTCDESTAYSRRSRRIPTVRHVGPRQSQRRGAAKDRAVRFGRRRSPASRSFCVTTTFSQAWTLLGARVPRKQPCRRLHTVAAAVTALKTKTRRGRLPVTVQVRPAQECRHLTKPCLLQLGVFLDRRVQRIYNSKSACSGILTLERRR